MNKQVVTACLFGALFESWLVVNGAALWTCLGVALGIVVAVGVLKLARRI